MKIKIKKAHIVDPGGSLHGRQLDLFIDGATISQAGENLDAAADVVVEAEGLHVSPGWFDLCAHSGEPGNESAETLESLCAAAAAGGFTDVLVMPDTHPAIDHKDAIYSMQQRTRNCPTRLHVAGALTKGLEGKSLAEIQDLHNAGAVAFTDARPTTNADVLLKTLLYVQPFNGLIINQPQDADLSRFGQMHEGIHSTMLGLRGIPSLAEELMIERDLRLVEYTNSRLHFHGLSSARGVQLIREAKTRGLRVTADVAFHNLIFNDSHLEDFDTHLKLSPPLRTEGDRQALIAALLDDTLDAIVTAHLPLTVEHKQLEFDLASPGATGLEQCFAALVTHVPELPVAKLVHKLAHGPRMVLGRTLSHIDVGGTASLSLFDLETRWTYGPERHSRSGNSVFLGKALKGRALGIISGGSHQFNAALKAAV